MHHQEFAALLNDYDPDLKIVWNRRFQKWIIYKPIEEHGRIRKSPIATLAHNDMNQSIIRTFRKNDPRRFRRHDGEDWVSFIENEINGERLAKNRLENEAIAHIQAHDIKDINTGRKVFTKTKAKAKGKE